MRGGLESPSAETGWWFWLRKQEIIPPQERLEWRIELGGVESLSSRGESIEFAAVATTVWPFQASVPSCFHLGRTCNSQTPHQGRVSNGSSVQTHFSYLFFSVIPPFPLLPLSLLLINILSCIPPHSAPSLVLIPYSIPRILFRLYSHSPASLALRKQKKKHSSAPSPMSWSNYAPPFSSSEGRG